MWRSLRRPAMFFWYDIQRWSYLRRARHNSMELLTLIGKIPRFVEPMDVMPLWALIWIWTTNPGSVDVGAKPPPRDGTLSDGWINPRNPRLTYSLSTSRTDRTIIQPLAMTGIGVRLPSRVWSLVFICDLLVLSSVSSSSHCPKPTPFHSAFSRLLLDVTMWGLEQHRG